MPDVKLFGSSRSAARLATKKTKNGKEKVKKPLKTLAIILTVILCLEGLYFFCIYTQNSFVSYWRTAYINTALSTMRHQWLATAFIPADVIQDVLDENAEKVSIMDGDQATSSWSKPDGSDLPKPPVQNEDPGSQEIDVNVQEMPVEEKTEEEKLAEARAAFFEVFWEVEPTSMDAYVAQHPEVLANGWEGIDINEAGVKDEGTSIRTIFDEQVLAINAIDKIILIRAEGSGYRGVLAKGKDPAQLSIEYSAGIGYYGDGKQSYGLTCGELAQQSGAILAMTASGFIDRDYQGNWGAGNGGYLAGYMMSNGYEYGNHYYNYGNNKYKRMELREDNLLYIVDVSAPVHEKTTDAMEFQPAMIVDGEILVSDWWIEKNPRTCIGQSDRYEILMLAIEGRRPLEGLIGTDVNVCAELLKQHGCMQAMNVDGGTSAMLWYDGENVIRCSNPNLENEGRGLPNIWAYKPVQIIAGGTTAEE